MAGAEALHAHLATGLATVARAWAVTRRDGVIFGFTDHDCPLTFDGITFKADSGLTARALQQATGLSVDNTEAMGALSDSAIREEDIAAGRFDGAEVVSWLVNWADISARKIMFRGHIGEVRRGAGAFHAELRGLTEALNRPIGRIFQKPCSAVLGDDKCRVAVNAAEFSHQGTLVSVTDKRIFVFLDLTGFSEGWFQRGKLMILSGAGAGLSGAVKRDRFVDGARIIELWEALRADIRPGDTAKVLAGCDKRLETCRDKFANVVNFRGFPDIPEEDWLFVHPTSSTVKTGGSRR